MKKSLSLFGVVLTLVGFNLLPISNGYADPAYHFLKEIPVGWDEGWDYLSIDQDAHRLYIAHSSRIMMVDLTKEALIGEIDEMPGVHGFAIAPDLQLGFASNGGESKVAIVELKKLQTIAKAATGANPDAVLYASGQYEGYAFNGHGQSVTVFEAKTGKVVATIPLPGKPEFAAYDPTAGLVYDNIEDKNEVVVINAKTHKIVNTWPTKPGESPAGMAIDTEHHRLFIGCHNNLMLMMDSTNGKVVATVPIGKGVDANAFDPATQLAFSSNGEGTLTVAHEETPDKLTVLQELKTQPGARTMAIDLKTHKIYLATAQFEPVPVPKPGTPAVPAPHVRPKIIPGTFKILVYGM